jgi:mRNA-degrading endonuclease HigB of HigAB toxin-antitoxin module
MSQKTRTHRAVVAIVSNRRDDDGRSDMVKMVPGTVLHTTRGTVCSEKYGNPNVLKNDGFKTRMEFYSCVTYILHVSGKLKSCISRVAFQMQLLYMVHVCLASLFGNTCMYSRRNPI